MDVANRDLTGFFLEEIDDVQHAHAHGPAAQQFVLREHLPAVFEGDDDLVDGISAYVLRQRALDGHHGLALNARFFARLADVTDDPETAPIGLPSHFRVDAGGRCAITKHQYPSLELFHVDKAGPHRPVEQRRGEGDGGAEEEIAAPDEQVRPHVEDQRHGHDHETERAGGAQQDPVRALTKPRLI